MKNIILLLLLSLLFSFDLMAQDTKNLPEFSIQQWEVESRLRFLASDELEGRRAGDRGNDIAARYLSDHFQALGLKKPENHDNYFQDFTLVEQSLPDEYQLILNEKDTIDNDNLMLFTGNSTEYTKGIVFVEYGWADETSGYNDYKDLDVKDKLVLCLAGTPESTTAGPRAVYRDMEQKVALAKEHGAIGIIEITQFRMPFSVTKRYLSGRTGLENPEEDAVMKDFLYAWSSANAFSPEAIKTIKEKNSKLYVQSEGMERKLMNSKNVIAILEGTDPELKNEYIMLSAHFDHVGAGKKANPSGNYVDNDSIYNGARDNAIGTVALMMAAQTLVQERPKRSVIFIGFNAEEMGLLGSQYYAENPIIPLDQVVYNLNVDGPGYNTTEHVSITGHGKTNTDILMENAIKAFGLGVLENPAPEQKGFYRSDNITFARLGIPAISMHQGVTAHDEILKKYYHQAADDADSVDMPYAHKFCQIYCYSARLIADMEDRPFWLPGDEFEEAGKELYQE